MLKACNCRLYHPRALYAVPPQVEPGMCLVWGGESMQLSTCSFGQVVRGAKHPTVVYFTRRLCTAAPQGSPSRGPWRGPAPSPRKCCAFHCQTLIFQIDPCHEVLKAYNCCHFRAAEACPLFLELKQWTVCKKHTPSKRAHYWARQPAARTGAHDRCRLATEGVPTNPW